MPRLMLALAMTVSLVACDRSAPPSVEMTPAVAPTTAGDALADPAVHLRLTVPAGWHTADGETLRRVMGAGVEMLDNKDLAKSVEASQPRLNPVGIISRHPVGAQVPFNPNISFLTESVAQAPQVKTGEDYLVLTRALLKQAQVPIRVVDTGQTRTIAGRTFAAHTQLVSAMNMEISSRQYVDIIDGRALVITLSYLDEQQRAELEKLLDDNLTFE